MGIRTILFRFPNKYAYTHVLCKKPLAPKVGQNLSTNFLSQKNAQNNFPLIRFLQLLSAINVQHTKDLDKGCHSVIFWLTCIISEPPLLTPSPAAYRSTFGLNSLNEATLVAPSFSGQSSLQTVRRLYIQLTTYI